jgi:nucleotidyltransferase substrate binding protein (TIGR01987 family)
VSNTDLRWIQRLSNFSRALIQLENAVHLANQRELTDLEKQGLIQAFEFTHELSWNLIKDYLTYQGATELITGSRDATREAFNRGLITNGETWMEMIKSRNKTYHTYVLNVAEDIVEKIRDLYFPLFKSFQSRMEILSQHEKK